MRCFLMLTCAALRMSTSRSQSSARQHNGAAKAGRNTGGPGPLGRHPHSGGSAARAPPLPPEAPPTCAASWKALPLLHERGGAHSRSSGWKALPRSGEGSPRPRRQWQPTAPGRQAGIRIHAAAVLQQGARRDAHAAAWNGPRQREHEGAPGWRPPCCARARRAWTGWRRAWRASPPPSPGGVANVGEGGGGREGGGSWAGQHGRAWVAQHKGSMARGRGWAPALARAAAAGKPAAVASPPAAHMRAAYASTQLPCKPDVSSTGAPGCRGSSCLRSPRPWG